MVRQLTGVTWDKYLGTDINEIVLFFDQSEDETEVDEYDVPEEEMHMIFYAEKKKDGSLVWVSVVNPEDVFNHEKATLPQLKVRVKDKTYDFRELINIFVAAEKHQNG